MVKGDYRSGCKETIGVVQGQSYRSGYRETIGVGHRVYRSGYREFYRSWTGSSIGWDRASVEVVQVRRLEWVPGDYRVGPLSLCDGPQGVYRSGYRER